MKKPIKNFLKFFLFGLFIGFLGLAQISFINDFPVLGAKINLVLIVILANIFNSSLFLIIWGAIIGGLIYDFTSLFNFSYLFSFLILIILFRTIGRRYLVEKHLFLNFFFGVSGTLLFNFFYVLINYLFFHQNFFDYFLSWRHLIEIFLNGLGTFLLGLIIEIPLVIKANLKY